MSSTASGAVILYTPLVIAREQNQNKDRWALTLNPIPGRTLNELYSSCGKFLEIHANRVAHRWGLGPNYIAESVTSSFGTREERHIHLARLREEIPAKLERDCSKLIKYTFPTESPKTQRQAFRSIVNLVTLFPGLRSLFLHSKCMRGVPVSTEDISALWDRPDASPDQGWTFWRTFAATCLSDTSISVILEECPVPQLTSCETDEGGLSVIERLLIAHDCETGFESAFSSALCVRYLAGILDLGGFWMEMGSAHIGVAKKMCLKMVWILKDIGADLLPSTEFTESESPFDYEGVDLLANKILLGISTWFSKIERTALLLQPWCENFREVLQLLRGPRSAILLPNSFAQATSEAFEISIPTVYRTVELDIAIEAPQASGMMNIGVVASGESELLTWDDGSIGRNSSIASLNEEAVDAMTDLGVASDNTIISDILTQISSPRGRHSIVVGQLEERNTSGNTSRSISPFFFPRIASREHSPAGSPPPDRAMSLLSGRRPSSPGAPARPSRSRLENTMNLDGASRDSKLARAADKLLSSLIISGVELRDEHARFAGEFGDVFRAMYQGKPVALKHLHRFQATDQRDIRRKFCREALVWQRLRHPHIVPLIGIDMDSFPSSLCMVSPWMQNGTVIKYLSGVRDEARQIIVDRLIPEIAQGLAFLHDQNIVHVDDDLHASLTDFGLSVFSDATAQTHKGAGSVRWMAPETLNPYACGLEDYKRMPASDIYAFACVCLEFYTGFPPFHEAVIYDEPVILQVVAGVRPPRPPGNLIPNHIWTMMQQCWAHNYADRPSILGIVLELMRHEPLIV